MRALLTSTAIAVSLASCGTAPHRDVSKSAPSAVSAHASLVHIPVREDGILGTLIVPDATRAYPGVLRIGGGEGGISVRDAETIASEGYAVLALAYFGMEGLPADLEEVPIEYFGKAISWLKRSSSVDSTRLGIVGISRGATLALLLPTFYDDFDAVIALAPSHVVWQSHYLDWDRYAERSSFTHRGKALPYVPYDFSNEAALVGCDEESAACVLMYEYSLNQHAHVRDALIPVEQIHAPILLLSGRSDSMWPSSKMSDLVVRRLEQASHPYEYRHIAYDDAGHCGINQCYDFVALGGDHAAVEDMRRQVIQFLDRHLKAKEEEARP